MDGLAMSIASLSTDMAMSKTMSAVSTAVMKWTPMRLWEQVWLR